MRVLPVLAAACWLAAPAFAADLTATELRWLRGVKPVIEFARAEGIPFDVVVQPQPTPGYAPLALAWIDGRCKLVFSMRGNPEAEATLERIAPALLDGVLELMAAHELGHCRRYLDGAWQDMPAGFTAASGLSAERAKMAATRREEAYGDLVGLAWAARFRPQQYEALHAWLVAERGRDLLPGSHHDTLAWIRAARLAATRSTPAMFEQAHAAWLAGLATIAAP
jgi:hypothetical protein